MKLNLLTHAAELTHKKSKFTISTWKYKIKNNLLHYFYHKIDKNRYYFESCNVYKNILTNKYFNWNFIK